jgi:uncharacterized protein YpmB
MKKRTMIFVTAMVLLFAIVTGSTIAYMTSTTLPVTNTFTYGTVSITLDEGKVGDNGLFADNAATRVMANSYKVVPGNSYDKDPTVHVGENSDSCYIFVNVINGFTNYEANVDGKDTVAEQMEDNGWINMSGNIWYKANAVTKGTNHVVFSKLHISDSLDNTASEAAAKTSIVITAYAIQSEGFTSATEAYAAAGAPQGW